jgi:glycogen debranching enzyme
MDAKVANWVVTPRMGKPVEIQALWYNALCVYILLLQLNGQESDARIILEEAKRVKRAFLTKFWYEEGGYLFDVIDENNQCNAALRPNQILAISLPFALIEETRAIQLMEIVQEKLYTPAGLRSLSPDDPAYIGYYNGDQWHRDAAYHQGTVWSWLIGPYVDAIFKTYPVSTAITKAVSVVNDFLPHLKEAGIGTISEIFDAEPPFNPKGCIAQAWSVAEILRVIKKYNIDQLSSKQRTTTNAASVNFPV